MTPSLCRCKCISARLYRETETRVVVVTRAIRKRPGTNYVPFSTLVPSCNALILLYLSYLVSLCIYEHIMLPYTYLRVLVHRTYVYAQHSPFDVWLNILKKAAKMIHSNILWLLQTAVTFLFSALVVVRYTRTRTRTLEKPRRDRKGEMQARKITQFGTKIYPFTFCFPGSLVCRMIRHV